MVAIANKMQYNVFTDYFYSKLWLIIRLHKNLKVNSHNKEKKKKQNKREKNPKKANALLNKVLGDRFPRKNSKRHNSIYNIYWLLT